MTCLVVGFGQLIFHLFRTWHIGAIAVGKTLVVFLTCLAYQATVIATFALGIDAFLSNQWGVVASFILGGAIGSAITSVNKP